MSRRVFIASTYLDNVARRELVRDAVIRLGMTPVGMEWLSASARPTKDECVRAVQSCDVVIVILAHRYGWIPPGETKAITELEYDAAKERLVFILSDEVKVDRRTDYDEGNDRWDKQKQLEQFKRRASSDQKPAEFRDNTLSMSVLDALGRWSGQLSDTALDAELTADDVALYSKRMLGLHDSMSIVGFSAQQVRVPIRLDELYVPLTATADHRLTGKARFNDGKDALEQLGDGHGEVTLAQAFPMAAKTGRRGLVVLGDPGTGKTTQLKRLALAVLREGAESIGLAPDVLPVLVALRDLKPGETDLDALITRTIEAQELALGAGFARKLIAHPKLLYLFDGLDEVPGGAERAAVARWIENALRVQSNACFVVTCRYAGYTEKARLNELFLELHLRPLTDVQADDFIRRWFQIVETKTSESDPTQAVALAKKHAERLIERLREPHFRARRVYQLIRNPLLLTAICLVHRDKGELPKRRAALYGFCTDVLLERWHSKAFKARIAPEKARAVLEPMAWFLHNQEGRTRATASELQPVLESHLGGGANDRTSARSFLATIRDDSGLITGWSGEEFGFLHLGFQEYMAARHVCARHSAGENVATELAGHLNESWWQEVTLLALAMDERGLFDSYLAAICELPKFEFAAIDPELQTFLALCFDEAARPSARALTDFVARPSPGFLQRLFAPRLEVEGLRRRQVSAVYTLGRVSPSELERVVGRFRPRAKQIEFALRMGDVESATSQMASMIAGKQVSFRIAAGVASNLDARTSVRFIRIPRGEFEMGGRLPDEQPKHRVRCAEFELATTPITNAQYERFLSSVPGAPVPEFWSNRRFNQPDQPVVGLSWEDVHAYCAWAGYRLPSEAEWEYAARAGSAGEYCFGDDVAELKEYGWYFINSGKRLLPDETKWEPAKLDGEWACSVHAVAQKRPNAWGLADMHGNVWEWCEDTRQSNYEGAPIDGSAWVVKASEFRVFRGGSFLLTAEYARSAYRNWGPPSYRWDYVGFRPARSVTTD